LYGFTITVGGVAVCLPFIDNDEVFYPLHSVLPQRRVYTGVSYVFETVV
jgi:hypothetical protein